MAGTGGQRSEDEEVVLDTQEQRVAMSYLTLDGHAHIV